MKKRNKLAVSLIGVSSILIFGNSTHALEIQNPLTGVLQEWEQQLNSINKYIKKTAYRKLDDLSEDIQGDLQAVVNESIGVLGLPDATEVRKKVEKIANSNDNAVNSVDKATNFMDRQITRASSDTTLSKEGQKLTQEQIEKTQTSLSRVEVFQEAAQNDVVTQNVMKRIAQQNTETAQILSAIRTDGLKAKQSQDMSNLNLTNISRSLDGQNQVRQKELVGQGFNNLRTASLVRLF